MTVVNKVVIQTQVIAKVNKNYQEWDKNDKIHNQYKTKLVNKSMITLNQKRLLMMYNKIINKLNNNKI